MPAGCLLGDLSGPMKWSNPTEETNQQLERLRQVDCKHFLSGAIRGPEQYTEPFVDIV